MSLTSSGLGLRLLPGTPGRQAAGTETASCRGRPGLSKPPERFGSKNIFKGSNPGAARHVESGRFTVAFIDVACLGVFSFVSGTCVMEAERFRLKEKTRVK